MGKKAEGRRWKAEGYLALLPSWEGPGVGFLGNRKKQCNSVVKTKNKKRKQ
jgi:hypothetical protein